MLLRTKSLIAVLCLLSLSSISLVGRLFPRRRPLTAEWVPALKGMPGQPCNDKLEWLAALDLTYPIRYAHRHIMVNPVPNLKRAPLTKVDESLFPDFEIIDLTDDSKVELQHCAEPLVLGVPVFRNEPSDASHIIFGISTTLKRLEESIPQLLRWLPHTHAGLFVIVIESEHVAMPEGQEDVEPVSADPAKKEELQSRMRGLGMDATLVHPVQLTDMFSVKYFSLIKLIFDSRNDKTQWISLLDDDTFFPSIPAILSMLGKYDPRKQHYIGSLSENWWAVTHYGMMGFGGAGVFLSLPLAEVISTNYLLCKETSHANAGDIRVMECIYLLTGTKLENEFDLHQIDVAGDLSGIYENGRLPLSLHHWKTGGEAIGGVEGNGYNLPIMHLVSDVCGDCFLQRWQFGKEMVLANGFSIALYPKGDPNRLNMDETEETWATVTPVEGSNNHGIDHSLAPTRPKLTLDEEKIQYRLIDSAVVEGGVRQSYLHRRVTEELDSLLEIFWMESEQPRK